MTPPQSAVIVRLDRAIQHGETFVIGPTGRGVLDGPVKPTMTANFEAHLLETMAIARLAKPRSLVSNPKCPEMKMPAIAPATRTRASANTSGPDFILAARLLMKLRSREGRAAPSEENSFLLPNRTILRANPGKKDDPTVDLMSRRHPLSSIRAL
jgi:hypothetical protein